MKNALKTFFENTLAIWFVVGTMGAINACNDHVIRPMHYESCTVKRLNGYQPIKCFDVNDRLDAIGFPFKR